MQIVLPRDIYGLGRHHAEFYLVGLECNHWDFSGAQR